MRYLTIMACACLVLASSQCVEADEPSEAAEASQALTSTTWGLTGSVTRTAVSGFSGTVYTLGTPSSTTKAAYAVLSNEHNNHPCFVAIGTEDLNDETIDSAPDKDLCGSSNLSSTMHADYLDINAGGTDDHIFISGISVCMNSAGDRVKGISVVGKRLDAAAGALVSVSQVWDSRTNCQHWESWVQCPSGQIATAVDAHFGPGGTPRDLIGLALQCRTVTR